MVKTGTLAQLAEVCRAAPGVGAADRLVSSGFGSPSHVAYRKVSSVRGCTHGAGVVIDRGPGARKAPTLRLAGVWCVNL